MFTDHSLALDITLEIWSNSLLKFWRLRGKKLIRIDAGVLHKLLCRTGDPLCSLSLQSLCLQCLTYINETLTSDVHDSWIAPDVLSAFIDMRQGKMGG